MESLDKKITNDSIILVIIKKHKLLVDKSWRSAKLAPPQSGRIKARTLLP
jgi:hypothetical protein